MTTAPPRELLSAIVADRRNDGLRLAYAEAVQATDAAHAEFIRLQLELEPHRSRAPTDEALRQRRARERKLEALLRPQLHRGVRPPGKAVKIHRGFVEYVLIDAATFLDRGTEVFAAAPILDLALLDAAPQIAAICSSPLLRGLRALVLRGCRIGDAGAHAIASSPHLGQLRWLDLTANDITDAGLEALAGSRSLAALAHLEFGRNVAADPTPEIVEDHGCIHFVRFPDAGKRLSAKHGDRAWIAKEPEGIPAIHHF